MEVPAPPSGADAGKSDAAPQRSKDEIALELMKFVAVTTGYGKGTGAAGFSGKPGRSPEEYADALLELFDRCRTVVAREPKGEK